MPTTYHLRIKKSYAVAVIEDLQKMEAVELLPENNIPAWHIEIVNERLENFIKNKEQPIDFDKAMDEIEKHL